MQRGIAMRKLSVCLSLCLSVRLSVKRMDCDKTKFSEKKKCWWGATPSI